MRQDGIFSVVLESPEDVWCIGAILEADDKIVVEEAGAPIAKPLLVADSSINPATSTLTVTGTHEEERSVTSQPHDILDENSSVASSASEQVALSLFPGRTVTVERRLVGGNMFSEKPSWEENVCQRIRAAVKPDRRSEALAVVLLDKNGSSATLRVFEGEQLRLDKTIQTADFKDDVIIDMPKMPAAKKAGHKANSSCSAGEKMCKDAKMARSTKGRMAPLQGNLYAAVIAALVGFVDLSLERSSDAGCCPLLIASLGEAAASFQHFLQTDATTNQNLPLLHMANNAVVVDTYGAASQAEDAGIDSCLSSSGAASSGSSAKQSKSKKETKKANKSDGKKASSDKNNKSASTAASAGCSAKSVEGCAAFEANLWMSAQRKNRDKKCMCAFDEMMMRPEVLAQIHNVRFSKASSLVKDVLTRMREEEQTGALGRRAVYGAKVVKMAVQEGAVGVGGGALLINKSQFQNKKIQDTLATLVTSVREEGGAVHIISDTHECGQRLAKLGGVAALLTFPLFGLDDMEDEESTKSEEKAEKPAEVCKKGRKTKTKSSN
ncbi:MAG: Translation factor pelota [Sporothrix thermara]